MEAQIVEFLEKNPKYVEVIKNALEYEQANPDDEFGFVWSDIVGGNPARLNKLVTEGVLRITYRTRTSCHYKLVDQEATRRVLRLLEDKGGPIIEEKIEVPKDMFDIVIGHEDVKRVVLKSLNAEKPVHVMFVGPPATAKTLMMTELMRLPNSRYCLGSTMSKAGTIDYLLEERPRYLIVDEIDRGKDEDQAALLSLAETGMVTRLKHRMREQEVLKTWIFACCNRDDRIRPELRSRFLRFQLREYTREEFEEVVQGVLVRREGISKEMAGYIAGVLSKLTKDVRDAIRIGRLCETKEEVDEFVKIIYCAKG